MIDTPYLIAITVALLFLLFVAWRRETRPDSGWSGSSPDRFDTQIQLPNRALLERCLAAEDVQFALMMQSPALLRLLLWERRRLALEWLRATRRETLRVYRLHVRRVQHASGLRPAAEMKLMAAVALFLLCGGLMMLSVSLYGPLRTQGFLESLRRMARILSSLGARIADSSAPGLAAQTAGGR